MADDGRSTGSRRISFGRRRPAGGAAPADLAGEAGSDRVSLAKPGGTGGKGRPTPKRSDAERRRGGPVAPPPTTRREAAKRQRAQQADQRRQGRGGPGQDPGKLLKRDAGPARSIVRDIVDSRRNVAVMLLPVALLLIIASTVKGPALAVMSRLWVATLLAVVIDVIVIALSIRRRLRDQPDAGGLGWHVVYGLSRSTVVRRFRMPTPQVAPPRLFGSR